MQAGIHAESWQNQAESMQLEWEMVWELNASLVPQMVNPCRIMAESMQLEWEMVWELNASLVPQMIKNLPAMQESPGLVPGSGRSLEKGMATHSSILACKEEPLLRSRGQMMGVAVR